MIAKFINFIYLYVLTPHKWVILIKSGKLNKWKELFQPVNLSRADPFIIIHEDKIYIFFEEFDIKERRGYLCVGEFNESNNTLDQVKIILSKEYHLSYPNIFQYKGEYYLIPETEENNSIDLYKFISFPHSLIFIRRIASDLKAVDTEFFLIDNQEFLFTSLSGEGYSFDDNLHYLILRDGLLGNSMYGIGDFKLFSSSNKNSRNAGKYFYVNEELYRYSQDSTLRYGANLNLVKMNIHDLDNKHEKIIKKIFPQLGYICRHTMNNNGGYTVTDAKKINANFGDVVRTIFILLNFIAKKIKSNLYKFTN